MTISREFGVFFGKEDHSREIFIIVAAAFGIFSDGFHTRFTLITQRHYNLKGIVTFFNIPENTLMSQNISYRPLLNIYVMHKIFGTLYTSETYTQKGNSDMPLDLLYSPHSVIGVIKYAYFGALILNHLTIGDSCDCYRDK